MAETMTSSGNPAALSSWLTIKKATIPFVLLLFFVLLNSQTIYPMAAVASLFVLALYTIRHLRASQFMTPIFLMVSLNIVYWIVNIIIHSDAALLLTPDFYRRDGKGFYIFAMLVVFLLYVWRSSNVSAHLSFFAKGLLIIGNLVAILSLLDYFHLVPALSLIDEGIGSGVSVKGQALSSGLYNNHNALAAYMGSVILIATAYYNDTHRKFWLLACLPLAGAFAIASSRSFTAAFSLVVLFMMFSGRKHRSVIISRNKLKIAIGIVVLIAAIITLQLYLGINRFQYASSMLGEHNVAYRFTLWLRALQYIKLSPLLGLGVGSFNDVFSSVTTVVPYVLAIPLDKTPVFGDQHAHNFILHLLAETGIAGLGLFLALLWVIYKRARKLTKMADSNAALIGRITILLLIYQFIAAMAANNFFAPSSSMLFWLFASFSFKKLDDARLQVARPALAHERVFPDKAEI